jgi:hypothetical protein
MSEQGDTNAGYDPEQDPDAQPESLNPRTGEEASSQGGQDEEYEDTDADPANLNPRAEGAEGGD